MTGGWLQESRLSDLGQKSVGIGATKREIAEMSCSVMSEAREYSEFGTDVDFFAATNGGSMPSSENPTDFRRSGLVYSTESDADRKTVVKLERADRFGVPVRMVREAH